LAPSQSAPKIYKSADRDEARILKAREGIARHYAGLEARLAAQPFLAGELSVADIGYFLTITFATNLGAALGEATPRLQAWYGRMAARPAVAKELMGLMSASRPAATA
jgi:glutathione S-transferase